MTVFSLFTFYSLPVGLHYLWWNSAVTLTFPCKKWVIFYLLHSRFCSSCWLSVFFYIKGFCFASQVCRLIFYAWICWDFCQYRLFSTGPAHFDPLLFQTVLCASWWSQWWWVGVLCDVTHMTEIVCIFLHPFFSILQIT